jgi:hypothetical protein
MEATQIGADELTRLQAVRARVRTLARNHGWFADAIRSAFAGYLGLGDRFQREKSAMHDRERRLARELLAKGWLFDPNARDNSPCLFVRVKELCPVALADRLGKHGRGDAMPRKLEREGAAAALASLDRDTIYQARDLPEKKREAMAAEYRAAQAAKTHVSFWWMIVVSRPADWLEPAAPHSLDRADLERFNDADYRTIALHRLGGLADVGALRPIVPKPKDTRDMVRDVGAYVAWRFRFPIDDHRDQNQPQLSVRALPPDVAEQLLDDVETWAKGEAATRGESLNASGPSVSPDLLDLLQRAAAAVDPGAIDRAAELAAEKIARVFGAGDNGDAKPKALPAGAEAIDEYDVALLAFLNRNPSLRRKVSDVLPDKGPQDRKAVAKRLRKLANRTPPLVDYPKDGRSGVVILPAGSEALNRATAPTPR